MTVDSIAARAGARVARAAEARRGARVGHDGHRRARGKRALDVGVAAAVLALMLPVMLVVAAAIVLESRGPVFYRAERVGRGGRPLRMLKFRKMRDGARGSRLTTAGDARLTAVGRVLVATRLDELPQFWHVLRGEMSLVGPRPEDPVFVASRQEDFDVALRVRPGITGLSQLAYAEERRLLEVEDPERLYVERILPEKCRLDALYARRLGLAMDARVLAWTLAAVALRRPVAVDRRTGRLSVRRRPSGRFAPPREA